MVNEIFTFVSASPFVAAHLFYVIQKRGIQELQNKDWLLEVNLTVEAKTAVARVTS